MARPLFITRRFRRWWNGRDDRGHYLEHYTVTKLGNDAANCPHACCQNAHPHPAGEPVQRATSSTTGAPETDEEALDRWYAAEQARTPKYSTEDSSDPADHEDEPGAHTARPNRAQISEAFQLYQESSYGAAEEATRGSMYRNDRAVEFHRKHPMHKGGHVDNVLFSGPASTAYYYASEELRRYWEDHPRLTLAEYAQQHGDTTAKTATAAGKARSARRSAATRAEESPERRAERKAGAARAAARRRGPLTAGDKLAASQRRYQRAKRTQARYADAAT